MNQPTLWDPDHPAAASDEGEGHAHAPQASASGPADADTAPHQATAYTLFDTPLGPCGIAWREAGICAFQLPEAHDAQTRQRLLRITTAASAIGATPTAEVQSAIDAVRALMNGEPLDLLDLRLDLRGIPEFHRRVYALTRQILPGQTRTYGELAVELGEPSAARAVGQALGANPIAVIVPCHRMLAAGGRSGGFSAPGGVSTKLRLLTIEKARIGGQPGLFDA